MTTNHRHTNLARIFIFQRGNEGFRADHIQCGDTK
ncbi:Uncharacterised protein [Vibrio cholerae]|nr:Uncharacterised protein [Vibrio cholerae]CSC69934.1 Uncharacterised protein [Vibrio cholerae]